MFTGLVEECGQVLGVETTAEGASLTVQSQRVCEGLQLGDSIAVNGCCLTATGSDAGRLRFDLLNETLQRTNLGALSAGAVVNLERALASNGRLGGHFVQGHIDCTSRVMGFERVGADYRLEIGLPKGFAQYVAFKGSIAINGISLTVAEVHPESFAVWIIPHTLQVTSLGASKMGDLVNLEFDLLAKYVERVLALRTT